MLFQVVLPRFWALLAGPALAQSASNGSCGPPLPNMGQLKTALKSAVANTGERRPRLQHVGRDRRQERDCVRGGVFWRRLHLAMARKPGDCGAEGQYGQLLQPRPVGAGRLQPGSPSPPPISFRRCSRAEASMGCRPAIPSTPTSPMAKARVTAPRPTLRPSARPRIRWSASASAASMCSAVASALYKGGVRVGGLGVSGDTSCTDHMIAWRTRSNLGLDRVRGVGGPAAAFAGDATHPDNIIFDITPNPTELEARARRPSGPEGSGRAPADSATRRASTIRPSTLSPASQGFRHTDS